MTSNDPLAGLDDVPWSELGHAYGEADDVPGLLRALTDHDRATRGRTLYALYSNIFHQGTRYEATAYAVPFLARLALEPGTFRRAQIVDLLGSITVGYDYAYLPGGIDPAAQRAEFEQLRTGRAERMQEFERWVAAAPDAAEREKREWRRKIYDYEAELQATDDHLQSYAAVRAQVPALRALLAETETATETGSGTGAGADAEDALALRASVAYLLAWFPEDEAAESVAALSHLLEREDDPRVRATALVALGLIGGAELIPALRAYLASEELLERWAAATALARLGDHSADVARALAHAAAEPPTPTGPDGNERDGTAEAADESSEDSELEEDEAFDTEVGPVRFLDGDIRGYASHSLVLLADSLTDEAFDAVLAGLARTSQTDSFAITAAALRLAFPAGPAETPPPFAELGERQRRVVRILADMGRSTWHWGNFTDILQAWRLPSDQAGLRAYAGLPPLD